MRVYKCNNCHLVLTRLILFSVTPISSPWKDETTGLTTKAITTTYTEEITSAVIQEYLIVVFATVPMVLLLAVILVVVVIILLSCVVRYYRKKTVRFTTSEPVYETPGAGDCADSHFDMTSSSAYGVSELPDVLKNSAHNIIHCPLATDNLYSVVSDLPGQANKSPDNEDTGSDYIVMQ